VQVGDLVKFVTPVAFAGAKREYTAGASAGYADAGIVTEVSVSGFFGKKEPNVAKVYWTDGRQTREHFCYLERLTHESK
jgi:hypothetical protein